jgi:DNA-binding NarL/FixJ family response regulator
MTSHDATTATPRPAGGPGPQLPDRRTVILMADPAPLFLIGAELVCAPLGVVAATVTDPGGLDAAVSAATPAAVLVNPRLWPAGGLSRCRELLTRLPKSRVGIIADRARPSEREQVRALGFDGYLDKPRLGTARLAAAIDALLAGEAVFPSPAEHEAESSPVLNGRELAVLHQLAAGSQVSEIAASLAVGERTVKATIASVIQRLGAANRVEAVAICCELELLGPAEPPRPPAGR